MAHFLLQNPSDLFFVLDSSYSHKQLLIRSKRNKDRNYNIDVLFKGVTFLQIPFELHGLAVSVSEDENEIAEFCKRTEHVIAPQRKLFVLVDSEAKRHFIVAMAVGVFHSPVDILETIIGRYDTAEFLAEEQYWYSPLSK